MHGEQIPTYVIPADAMSDPMQLLTREQVAEILQCSTQWVSRLTGRKALHSVKIGRRVLIPRGSLSAFLRGEQPPWESTRHRWPPEPELPLG